MQDPFLLSDDTCELGIVDTRHYLGKGVENPVLIEDLPTKITGTYNHNYNILYIDDIIRRQLNQEKYIRLQKLKTDYQTSLSASRQPQTVLNRGRTIDKMKDLEEEMRQITTGEKLQKYMESVKGLLDNYRKFGSGVTTIMFDEGSQENSVDKLDDEARFRIYLIDTYLEIAARYLTIDIIRLTNCSTDSCIGCGTSLRDILPNDSGLILCPNLDCQTENAGIILNKLSKDSARVNMSNTSEDESIDNFLRAFMRYQGVQIDHPDEQLYTELDQYFIRIGKPELTGEQVRRLPLNSRGRRGETTHKMLWYVLSQINRSVYYEDTNLIGHIYWGWELPDVMNLREIIIDHYNKTQKVFYEIPPEERCRDSSLGTQYRLWRHLQLLGHECYMDEFKIADNPDSLRIHNKLWRLMCEGAKDSNIYYID